MNAGREVYSRLVFLFYNFSINQNKSNMKYLAIFFLVFLSFFNSKNVSAQNPEYTLTAKNFNFQAADSLTFEVFLIHTNTAVIDTFQYASGQYFFLFNPAIANGGTLSYRIIGSGLPVSQQPRNPTVSNNELRLAGNAIVGQGNGFIIPSNSPGVLVVKMSLKTSAGSFAPNENLDLQWKNAPGPGFFTRIYAYVNMLNTEVTVPGNHFIDTMQVSVNQISSLVPTKYELQQNYPNPFNPSTTINFSLPKTGLVSLKVYDISGKEISNLVNENLNVGTYEYKFNAASLSSGIYFYTLKADGISQTKRMMLIK
ncbi:MAG TPA: T9SS type A sorting domain-containing protein [Ignavibacteria bacterium]|nr:T9SS type A sorting domain-containing protein [Ignavibacteria bacterium]